MKPDVLLPERHEPPRFRDWDVRLLLKDLLRTRAKSKSEIEPLIDRRAS
jgi:hypothetical protein